MAAKKPMTKTQLIEKLALDNDVPKVKVKSILDDLAKTAYSEAKVGFTVPGIGKLTIGKRKARTGRNPRTGETMKIPAGKVVKFRISKTCKDAVVPPKK